MFKFFDGAFGTYYLKITNDISPCEQANLTNPEAVLKIHQEYIQVGAQGIKTNTFNANLGVYKTPDRVKEIITAGFQLAQKAAENTDVKVFADIGYIQTEKSAEAMVEYQEIAKNFLSLGAQNFIFETLGEYEVVTPAIELIKTTNPQALVIVSFAVGQDGYSKKGLHYKSLLSKAAANPYIDAVGLNCLCGPAYLLNLVKALPKLSKPLAIMPNAGYPYLVNGRTVFQSNSTYFADKIKQLAEAGVSILGGCCGTTPNHIKLAIQAVRNKFPAIKSPNDQETSLLKPDAAKLPLKPLAIELDPPQNTDLSYVLQAVDQLKALGVNTITFADSPLAKARADSIMTAGKIKREKNIQVLPHLSCRDKNQIAIKGSLLGASYDEIDQILIITGDPMLGDSPYKKAGVFSFNSLELISYIQNLNQQVFQAAPFKIGAALNVNAPNFSAELSRCQQKIQNGASFLFSQPIFSQGAIDNFILAKKQLKVEIFGGILPVASYKNAVFLNNEVSGIKIPTEVLAQLANTNPEEAQNISISFTQNIIQKIYPYADGFYIMTPLKKTDLVCNLIKRCFNV